MPPELTYVSRHTERRPRRHASDAHAHTARRRTRRRDEPSHRRRQRRDSSSASPVSSPSPRARRRHAAPPRRTPSTTPSPHEEAPPPPPPPRHDSLHSHRVSTRSCDASRISAENMVQIANGGARNANGSLAHFLTDGREGPRPARSDVRVDRAVYLRVDAHVQPKSSLSLRADSACEEQRARTLRPRRVQPAYFSVEAPASRTLYRQPRLDSNSSGGSGCLCPPPPHFYIPPPESFDF